MAPSSSAESPSRSGTLAELSDDDGRLLLDLADRSIVHGLDGGGPLPVELATVPLRLRMPAAVFVTVFVDGELNGCVGTLEPVEPLAVAVARLAWEAAFCDPRLPVLEPGDYPRMGLDVSVLTPPEPIAADSLADLAARLRPYVDGLTLVLGRRRATFLPAVWEKLPDARQFVLHLQAKAGIPVGSWPAGIEASRYRTQVFERL